MQQEFLPSPDARVNILIWKFLYDSHVLFDVFANVGHHIVKQYHDIFHTIRLDLIEPANLHVLLVQSAATIWHVQYMFAQCLHIWKDLVDVGINLCVSFLSHFTEKPWMFYELLSSIRQL